MLFSNSSSGGGISPRTIRRNNRLSSGFPEPAPGRSRRPSGAPPWCAGPVRPPACACRGKSGSASGIWAERRSRSCWSPPPARPRGPPRQSTAGEHRSPPRVAFRLPLASVLTQPSPTAGCDPGNLARLPRRTGPPPRSRPECRGAGLPAGPRRGMRCSAAPRSVARENSKSDEFAVAGHNSAAPSASKPAEMRMLPMSRPILHAKSCLHGAGERQIQSCTLIRLASEPSLLRWIPRVASPASPVPVGARIARLIAIPAASLIP